MGNTNTPNSMPKMPNSPKKDYVPGEFPKAPVTKESRKTGERPQGTQYLRNHLNKTSND